MKTIEEKLLEIEKIITKLEKNNNKQIYYLDIYLSSYLFI